MPTANEVPGSAGADKQCLPVSKPLVISTYNVRTLYQEGKNYQLFMGCADAGIDIIGIQEHRLITTSPTDELWSDDKNWVLAYSSASDNRQGGVGFLMSKHVRKCLQSIESVNERILTATFYGNPLVTITTVYAPTEAASDADKEEFYLTLKSHLESVKSHNLNLVIGDFNARIGLDSHVFHPSVIGQHCFYDQTNNNGERLVIMCEELKLRPAQPRYPHPRNRLRTWTHPAGWTIS